MSGEATIRRGVRNARYAAIPNHVFEDARLSMEARWLLSYLLSKPDNWTVVIGDIVKKGNCGRDKARKMIAELVETGYAEREQTRADGKFGATVLVIFDEPRQAAPDASDVSDATGASDTADASGGSSASDASGNADASNASAKSDGSDGSDAPTKTVAFLPQTETPAPVKSAPSNNLDLAKTDSYQGEGVCELVSQGNAVPAAHDKAAKRTERARIGRQFDAWYKLWPKPGSPEFARNAWFALSAEERDACIERTPAYLAWAKRDDLTAPAVYLKARAWTDLPDHLGETQEPARVVAKPCGKLWMGRRLEALLSDPTGPFFITAFDERRIATGAISREALIWEKRREHGWPLVVKMQDRALRGEPFVTSADLLPLVADFVGVKPDSDLFAAWRRLHERRGWMFIDGRCEWNYFPPVDPAEPDLDAAVEAALQHFKISLSEGRTHDAA
ncbi:helix-turn-helix domain-containing protein [Agrobacterium vitis]|uniref:helix-turn-helix domain-containing protein n=1 Tax=Agrobacterium vitis TaxID=373 RepID=UPI001574973C|nr:helix-turn-helix domain-containing protein [Agrobacterium vitis]NSZ16350.1 helix-turn-helix domain-containing protein [Agrobacterium vitis]QZO05105.1 helix-turn-helix domain-containing protein [Agrobacterium vitis]UJL87253.1 helix-turn-helix domain-containing protein [Agrobacterium vitis]